MDSKCLAFQVPRFPKLDFQVPRFPKSGVGRAGLGACLLLLLSKLAGLSVGDVIPLGPLLELAGVSMDEGLNGEGVSAHQTEC